MSQSGEFQTPALTNVFYLIVSLLLLCGAGVWSGLTVGLMGIDRNQLRIKVAGSNEYEKSRAALLLRITDDRHRLLITLLLMNTTCLECLPLVLELAVPEVIAILISVVGVLIFGEVIPMSVLTGPRQFQLNARMAPLVQFFLCVMYPVNLPCGKLLDWVVGKEQHRGLDRRDLRALIQLNCEQGEQSEQQPCSGKTRGGSAKRGRPGGVALDQIDHDETRLVVNALDFCSQTAGSCLRGLNEVFMLEESECLNDRLLTRVRQAGFSRVPIFSEQRSNVLGVLLVKELVGIDTRPEQTLRDWAQSQSDQETNGGAATKIRLNPWWQPLTVSQELPLLELLGQLRNTSECRMAVVVEPLQPGTWKGQQVLGIVTLSDVFEELLQGQIHDEIQASRTEDLVNVIGNAQAPLSECRVDNNDVEKNNVLNNCRSALPPVPGKGSEEHMHSSLRDNAS